MAGKRAFLRSRPRWLAAGLAAVFLTLLGAPGRADDSAVQGVGGALKPMQEHPSIEMLAERVEVSLTPAAAEVDCLFTFRNTGPATTVRMGFSESASGDVSYKKPTGFLHFSTWVDGRQVRARAQGFQKRPHESGWQRWRVKLVRFGFHQKRLVRVRYGMGLGEVSDGSRFFVYRLDTGASWKGPISQAEVIIRLHRFPPYWRLKAGPAGYQRKGNLISWHWRDLEPVAATNIFVSFFPGYNAFVLNGKRLYTGESGTSPPLLRDSQAWASLRSLAEWTRSQLEWDSSSRMARLHTAVDTLSLQPSSLRVMSLGGTKHLSSPPRLVRGRLLVPVNEIITMLGGTARFDRKTATTYLTLPWVKPEEKKTFRTYFVGEWILRSRSELRREEIRDRRRALGLEGGPAVPQFWRQRPAQVVRADAFDFLLEKLRSGGTVMEEFPEHISEHEPALVLRKDDAVAEYFLLQKLDNVASVRLVVNGEEKAVFRLERPVGNWWYITGIHTPSE